MSSESDLSFDFDHHTDVSLNFDSSADSSLSSASSASTQSSSSSSSSSDSDHSTEIHMSPQGSGTSRSTSASSNRAPTDNDDSSATEDYEMPQHNGEIIDLSSTQFMTQAPAVDLEDDDDDVMLIPQHIETIDLCTESILENPRRPLFVRDEVIEIQDSPAAARRHSPPQAMRAPSMITPRVGMVSHPPQNRTNRTSPYQAAAAARKTPPKPKKLNLDDSQNESTQRVKITCPICLDSSMKRKMVSTKCGHIHCEDCLKLALVNLKKCPVCRKALTGKEPYHPIFFNGH